MSKTNQTVYFVIEGQKIIRGKKAINIFRITKNNLIPELIGQISYRPEMTQGSRSEVMHWLIAKGIEKAPKGYTEYSYYSDFSDKITIDSRAYWLELK